MAAAATSAAGAVSSSRPSPFLQPNSNAAFVSFPRRPLPAATLAISAPSQLPVRGSALVPAANPKYHNAKADAGDEEVNGEELLRRFTWQVSRAGVMEEIRRRRRHEDARDKRKRKALYAARRFRRRWNMAAEENTQGQDQVHGEMAATRIRRTRSEVWKHFARFTADDGKDKAECKRCRVVLGADTRNGTSSLWGHVKICNDRDGRPISSNNLSRTAEPSGHAPDLQQEAGSETGMEEAASGDLARMIALHGYDPLIVEDNYFRSFVHRLDPKFKVPSRIAIEEMCDAVFDKERTDQLSRLENTHGKISLGVGKVRIMEGEVICTTCHFIDDEWNLQKMVMDVYMVVPGCEHHGPLLGIPEVCVEEELLGIRKIGTTSFESNLDRLFMMAWGITGNTFFLEESRQRCRLEHYLTERFWESYPMKRGLVCSIFADNMFQHIIPCLTSGDLPVDHAYKDMGNLHLTRQKRDELLSDVGLDCLLAYNEDWYSCYCSLEVLRSKVSPTNISMTKESRNRETLYKLLGVIYHGLQTISASACPTSNLCLMELFKVREALQFEISTAVSFYIEGVLRTTNDDLDKHILDSYLVWSIPLVLDPRYKLKYTYFLFERAFGSDAADYVSKISKKLKELYADYIGDNGGINGADHSDRALQVDIGSDDPLEEAWDEYCRLQDGIAELDSYPENEAELYRYLKDRLVPRTEGFDILTWWKVHSLEYPTVARMARDALAMPTSSKLSSELTAHVKSMVRGYSKEPYVPETFSEGSGMTEGGTQE